MTGAIRARLARLERVAPDHPLKGLSPDEQVEKFFGKFYGGGWLSEAEHQAWICDMSEDALDLAIARLTAKIEAHPDFTPDMPSEPAWLARPVELG
jgi:hypothetical protein